MGNCCFQGAARALAIMVVLLSGVACAPQPPVETSTAIVAEPVRQVPVAPDKAQKELASGIASYENGSYKQASKQLNKALSLGLKVPADKACAHKYLAFINCVGGRQGVCRDEFRKALAADPSFDLTPAEAGHPFWGPVFRKLKAPAK